MPITEGVLNFTNSWYESAVQESVAIKLPNGTPIRLVTAPYFIATKLEAFYGRGQGQFHSSHDIEDIVNLIDGRDSVAQEIREQQGNVQSYLREEIESLLSNPDFLEAVPAHFLPNSTDQSRVPIVFARLREIAGV